MVRTTLYDTQIKSDQDHDAINRGTLQGCSLAAAPSL